MADSSITSVQWVHDTRARSDGLDILGVKEKIVTIDSESLEIISAEDNYRIIEHPRRTIHITKPKYQTHTNKKESEARDRVDAYEIEDRYLNQDLQQILGLRYAKQRMSLKDLCNSPYVYSADVSMSALNRLDYIEKSKHRVFSLTTGGYDHEQSVLGCERINCITVVLGKYVYTAVLADFVGNNVDSRGRRSSFTEEEVTKYSYEVLAPYIEDHGFQIRIKIFQDELTMFRFIARAIDHHKVDFIGIWNIDYDIPAAIDRIDVNGSSFAEVFHSKSIDPEYMYAKYKPDLKPVQHITDRWPWMHQISPSQFVDQMLLYARIRKAKTKESKYTLDYVSSKVLGKGKLALDAPNHFIMQQTKFKQYVAYNIADAILLQLMFWKTKDHLALVELTGNSPLCDFNKQSVMLKDGMYAYYKSIGRVLGTVGNKNEELHSQYLGKIGGTVLPTYLIKGAGLHALKGHPGVETLVTLYNFDEDYTAIYPSTEIAYNISKETKKWTVVDINGSKDTAYIENYFSNIVNPMENAVPLCTEYHGLPGYLEMDELFGKHLALKYQIEHRP